MYNEGKIVSKEIQKAIKYYKNASNNNDQFAKNNLEIIYKNEPDVKNLYYAIELFEEVINTEDDEIVRAI